MEITQEFVQFFIDKLQGEVGELNKTKIFQSAQIDFLEKQLKAVQAEVVSLNETYTTEIDNLKKLHMLELEELDAKHAETYAADKLNKVLGAEQQYQGVSAFPIDPVDRK